MIVGLKPAIALGKGGIELHRENRGRNPDQLAPMVQIELPGYDRQQSLAFRRQGSAARINLADLVAFRNVLQQTDFSARKQWQQVLETDGKSPMDERS